MSWLTGKILPFSRGAARESDSLQHKTHELDNHNLDVAVAHALGLRLDRAAHHWCGSGEFRMPAARWSPSTLWSQGGPIIQSQRIQVWPISAGGTFYGEPQDSPGWLAKMGDQHYNQRAETPLVAAMRAFVFAKFGGEIEIK